MFFSGNKAYYIILIVNLLLLSPSKVVAQTPNASSPTSNNNGQFPASGRYHFSPAMSTVFVIVIIVFSIIGCFSVFRRRFIESESGNRRTNSLVRNLVNRRIGEGLESNVIETFPTFLYSDVKKVKVGGTELALECAICLNEFKDDETLRLVPKCCHVFHPECIDMWLTSHVTCPVCRADLVPVPGETRTINCNLDEASGTTPTRLDQEQDDVVLSSRTHQVVRGKFGRSHSTDDLLIRGINSYERFTLRLTENVQKKLAKPELRRAKSNLVFPSASSAKRGFRSSSSSGVGVGASLQIHNSHQQSDREDRWGFTVAPPFLIRSHSVQAPIGGDNKSPFERLFSGSRTKDETGERSSTKLMGNNIV